MADEPETGRTGPDTARDGPGAALTERTVTVAGMRIRVYVAEAQRSDRPPLLLLHGGAFDNALLSWGGSMAALAENRYVLAPDLPGYGESDRPEDSPYSVEWYAGVVRELADTLGLQRFDLGGLSLGGGVALAFALSEPDRLRRLILVAPHGLTRNVPYLRLARFLAAHPRLHHWVSTVSVRSPRRARRTLRSGAVVNRERLTDDLAAQVVAAARSDRALVGWLGWQRSELGPDGMRTCFLEQLPRITVPTLLLSGAQDRLIPSEDCHRAAEVLPDARLEVLDRCGHWLPRDQPVRFVDVVDEFLADHPEARSD